MKSQIPCIFTPFLRERGGGIYENMLKSKILEETNNKFHERTFKPEGGESHEEVESRTKLFLWKVIDTHLINSYRSDISDMHKPKSEQENQKVLIVSHKHAIQGFIRSILKTFNEDPGEEMVDI